MTENTARQKLIHLAICGTFPPKMLLRASEILRENPAISMEELLLRKMNDLISSQAVSLLKKTRGREKELLSQQTMNEYRRLRVCFKTIYDDDYPFLLKESYQPPAVLFYQGDWNLLLKRKLGVVGSRKNTGYSSQVLAHILPDLLQKDVCIISGLAAGVDREAHLQTITLGGKTIGVIGSGLDYFYPQSNQRLQTKIAEEHLLLSEYPLDTAPARHHFPMRNRIISGLSHGILVVEAEERSGSLITANLALQENREVFAVPGNILENNSKGTNQLIQAGAKLVADSEDIFQEMGAIWDLPDEN